MNKRNDLKPDYAALSFLQLDELIKGHATLTENSIKEICAILAEMLSRRMTHPLMNKPLYRNFAKVADGSLSIKAVMAFCAAPALMNAVQVLPVAMQDRIADGEVIPVAKRRDDGTAYNEPMPALRMDVATITRVFGPKGIRGVVEQQTLITAELAKAPAELKVSDRITVQPGKEKVTISGRTVAVADLREPLRLLGYKLVRITPAKLPSAVAAE